MAVKILIKCKTIYTINSVKNDEKCLKWQKNYYEDEKN